MTRPEHEQLPDHLRRGIDDELARMQAEDQICAGPRKPSPLKGLAAAALIVLVLLTVLFVTLGMERGAPFGPDTPVILVTPLTTYGAPTYVP